MLVLVCSPSGHTQDLTLSFHHLTEEQGLPEASDGYHFFQDSRDYLWIGTDHGLLRFDGRELKTYTPGTTKSGTEATHKITSPCFEDQAGNLWFTTSSSVSCYQVQVDSVASYTHDTLMDFKGFHLSDSLFFLRIGSGNQGKLFSFNLISKFFRQGLDLGGKQCTAIRDHTGAINYLLSSELYQKPGMEWIDLQTGMRNKIQFQYTRAGYKRTFPSPTRGVFIENDSLAWIGLYDGIGRYVLGDSLGWIEMDRGDAIDFDIGWVSGITRLDDYHLLISATSGLLVFDKPKQKFVQQFHHDASTPYGLRLRTTNHIYRDGANNIWLSSPEQNVAFANLFSNRFSALPETVGKNITAIAEDPQGNLWCSTLNSGTYVYAPNQQLIQHTTTLKNLVDPDDPLELPSLKFFFHTSPENWWGNIGNNFLLWNPNAEMFEFRRSYFMGVATSSQNRINYCYQLADGTPLVARGKKIYQLNCTSERVDTIPWFDLNFLELGNIRLIYQSSDQSIFLADEGQLMILKEQDQRLIPKVKYAEAGEIYSVEEDLQRGLFWIAGSRGLAKISMDSLHLSSLEHDQGLAATPYHGMGLDTEGKLWLTSSEGLLRYDPGTNTLSRFNQADGLLSGIFSKDALVISKRTEEFWVGTRNGVNVFAPEEIKLLDHTPQVKLSRFLVNDEPFAFEENFAEKNEFTFNYRQNTLSFEVAALEYSDPESNRFYYQMEDVDQAMVSNGDRNFIRYPNLPADDYTFKVWATNSDGLLNQEPLELSITITPPFWRTWWFYLLSLIVMSGIIYGIFRYRLEQALKVERLRVKISSDLHDDVGGLLSGLAMQSEILELDASAEVKPKLSRIAEQSRKAMSIMRDTVWAIDARKDEFKHLIDRMHEHAEEVLEPKDILLTIQSNIDPEMVVSTHLRQNIYLIYKEAITNVAKHSNGDRVMVTLHRQAKQFTMSIADNGTSGAKPRKTSGLGLSNMKLRAKQIGAELHIAVDNGYLIELRLDRFV